ncbi:NF038122 family metalloprotease [Mastigocoleus sp. MO_188.B34]|uniref:NF038122 family metalloprotease n=1 Tax=Mastigocoleus sp. MO_188.B34 TaxID=3036635 RepID=UPI00262524EB|nr:NF038122 family metalloprotease [Mastigocoleus sp. MO_188.B34]MDJ0697671.1 NF038122 family metalloprotease [Mastigocoleus sp. MO_188.B34]
MIKSTFIRQVNNFKRVVPLTFTLITGIFGSTPAQAIQFNFTYTQNTSQEVVGGFLAAGDIWSSKIGNTFLDPSCSCNKDTTVNIHIDFTQLGNSKGLGATRPTMLRVNYQKFLNSSFKSITSIDDLTTFKSLQIAQSNKEYFLQSLGVDLQENTYEENFNILQQQGFNINSILDNVAANSNNIITAQAQDIFKQLNLTQLQNLNRDLVEFDSSTFNMRIEDHNTVNVDKRDQVDMVEILDAETIIDQNGNDNNKKIWLTRANAKALKLINGDDTKSDAEILLSNSMFDANGEIISYADWLTQNPEGNFLEDTIWDFSRVNDPNAEVASNKFDFLSVALHEIGHALGVVSGVDAFNSLKMQAETNSTTLLEEDIALVSSMDLLRFSEESKQNGVFDWSSSGQTFLSIDGGQTKLADFADGNSYQTSHWSENGGINGSPLGIMHPVLGKGEKLNITDLDLRLLDVLGYTKADEEVNLWLQGSAEQLSQNLSTASLQQTAKIFSLLDSVSEEQKEAWETRLIQAVMDMRDVNEETARNHINNLKEFITNILVHFDFNHDYGSLWNNNQWNFFLSYNSWGSSSGGFNFWQEMDTANEGEASQSSATDENDIEDAYSMFFDQEYQAKTTPEPNTIAGLGILGIFGWLHRRYRKNLIQ